MKNAIDDADYIIDGIVLIFINLRLTNSSHSHSIVNKHDKYCKYNFLSVETGVNTMTGANSVQTRVPGLHANPYRKAGWRDSRLRRYERRWLVERFFAWIQWQRCLLVRWEYYSQNFLGFVQLASIAILLKQF